MKLNDLFSLEQLEQDIKDGFVVRRFHPTLPLAILNYTDMAAYDNHWNEVTLRTRGLSYDTESFEIYGRPYEKFFNLGQPGAAEIDPDEPVVVTDKLDGCLFTLFSYHNTWVITSRGSFEGFAADEANEQLLLSDYRHVKVPQGVTLMGEIISPATQILLDYGDRRELVLHGAIDNETGAFVGDKVSWPYRADVFEYKTLAEAILAPQRPNAEGLVIRSLKTGDMVKIKQEDYLAAARIVNHLSDKGLWQHLKDNNGDYSDLAALIPDEFFGWLQDKINDYLDSYHELKAASEHAYAKHADIETKKDFFMAVKDYNMKMRTILLAMRDGKDIDALIWKLLKPNGP